MSRLPNFFVLAASALAGLVLPALILTASPAAAGSWSEDQFHDANPGRRYSSDTRAFYSYPVNTYPDGWAALKAAPSIDAPRLAKIPEGTLFKVIDAVPGWSRVRFKSGETGWIASRLVGCCRPASR